MSNGDVVTMEQIKALILCEKLKPEQLFDEAALKPLRDEAHAAGYAEGVFKRLWEKDPLTADDLKPKKEEADKDEPPDNKYIDPSKNPMIKI